MRNFKCSIADMRKQVFAEVARLAYEGGDYRRMEKLPYKIVPGEVGNQRESIFLERAIVGERIRLAMGLPLRPAQRRGGGECHRGEVLRSSTGEHHKIRL